MYDYYKSIQLLNTVIFKSGLTILIMGFLLLVLDIHKERFGYLGFVYVIFAVYYAISSLSRVLNAIPYYQNLYEAFDFSIINQYEPSVFAFDVAKYLSIAIIAISVLLAVTMIFRLIQLFLSKRSAVHD
jgi:hypothetical protein